MTSERVMEMLRGYRFELGRCGHLQVEIKELERKYQLLSHDIVDAMVSPGAQQISDMPHGTSVGNPTERYAMRLVDGLNDPELKQLEIKIATLQDEYNQRQLTVLYVESWLSGLSERERWVVEAQVIDSVFWKDICTRYRQKFEEDCSKDTLKRCRDRALDKIYEMAS